MNITGLLFLSALLAATILITLVSFLVIVVAQKLKSSRVLRLSRKHDRLLAHMINQEGLEDDELIRRLIAIDNVRIAESIIDAAANKDKNRAHEFSRIYDGTGITESYIATLRDSSSWKRRAFAAEKLGQIGSSKAVPQLLSTIRDVKDEDEDVRATALRALGRIKDKRAIPFLIEALGSPETWLPPRIAEILVSIGDESIEHLVRELRNYQNESRRTWAAEILGWLGAETAAVPLIDALSDLSPEVRAKAAGALGKIKDERSVEKLTELLISDPIPFVRIRASQALGAVGHPGVIDYLINVLKDPEWWVRMRAVEALEQFGETAVSALLIALEDGDSEVRKQAGLALQRIGYVKRILEEYAQETYRAELRKILFLTARTGVIASLIDKLSEADDVLKKRIVRLLGEAGVKEASAPLLSLLHDSVDWTLKSRIIEALGKVGADEAVPAIIEALKDDADWVRRSAVEALAKLDATAHGEEIAAILEDPNPVARQSALKTLSKLGVKACSEKVEKLLADPTPKVRAEAVRVLQVLNPRASDLRIKELFQDTIEEVRVEVIRYFSDLSDPKVFQNVLHLLPNGSEITAQAIIEYIRNINPKSFGKIEKYLPQSGTKKTCLVAAIRIAAIIGDASARDYILDHIEHDDEDVRAQSIMALSEFGTVEHEKIFARSLFDPSKLVRVIALTSAAPVCSTSLFNELLPLAEDPEEDVRAAFALAVGCRSDPELQSRIAALTEDPSTRVVAAAFIGLAAFDEPALLRSFYTNTDAAEIRAEIQGIYAEATFQPIVQSIRERARDSHNQEVEFLLATDLRAFAEGLIGRIKQSLNPEVRAKAVELLKMVATGDLFPAVLGILKKDPSEDVRIKAMDVVTSIGRTEDVISALASMLVDPSLPVRCRSAELLGQYEHPKALDALLHTLDASERQFREAVTTALSRLLAGNPARVAELVKKVPEKKARKLGMAWLMGKTRRKGALRFLTELLADVDPDVRAAAVGALRKFKQKQLIPKLRTLIYDPNERVRAAAVNTIAEIGGDQAIEVLRNSLDDVDQFVRMRTAVGLARLDKDTCLEELRKRAGKTTDIVPYARGILWANGDLYHEAVANDPLSRGVVEELSKEEDLLKELRSSSDRNKRLHAFRTLELIRSEHLEEFVKTAHSDPAEEIRNKASEFLEKRHAVA